MSEKLPKQTVTQGRKPPAYQEYAANMLANRDFRIMSLAERGLFYTLRLECWQNGSVPCAITVLAKCLGCDIAEIETLLTERVKSFFNEEDGSLFCTELDDYRKYLQDKREKQQKGGEKGAAITNARKNNPERVANTSGTSKPSSTPQLTRQVGADSLVKQSLVKHIKTQSLDNGVNDYWVKDYDNVERLSDNEYQRIKEGS
jgi:hypothetical protein